MTWELHLAGCQSLKDKRHILKSLKDRLHNRFNVSAAETARLINEMGGQAISRVCDAASETSTKEAADAAHDAFGRLDILVSGAAPHDRGGKITDITIPDWQRVLDINLTGSFLLSRAVLAAHAPYQQDLPCELAAKRAASRSRDERAHAFALRQHAIVAVALKGTRLDQAARLSDRVRPEVQRRQWH